MSKVVTRFAPSPTGTLHLGSARTALYSYAYAKKMGGRCILRIEDSDASRSTQESLIDIISGLEWLGFKFDSGPTLEDAKNGNYSKDFFQSKRADIYNEYIEKLLSKDKAYIGENGAVMFRMPQTDVSFSDMILGYVKVPKDQQKDFPIRRANGQILFHACVCIDDALMGVTNVIRANDHLTNTPKHIELFKAFGFEPPKFAHMPLILDDKREKLSKRRTDQFVLIKDFRKNGVLPETIINILGLMGWSNKDKKAEFGLDYICQNFDILDCGKANAVYDQKKLNNINSEKIKKMTLEQFRAASYGYGKEFYPEFMDNVTSSQWNELTAAYHSRSKTLSEMFRNGRFFITNNIEYQQEIVEKLDNKLFGILEDFVWFIGSLHEPDWTEQNLTDKINQFVADSKIKINDLGQIVRFACSGTNVTPPLHVTLAILGKDRSIQRMRDCLNYFCPKTEAKEAVIV